MKLKENLANIMLENNVTHQINIGICTGQSMIGIGEFEGDVVSIKINSKKPVVFNPSKYFSKSLVEKEVIWLTMGDNTITYYVKDKEDE